jgi:DHA1 family multidrug resistance protein-like MFS transporter
MVNMEISQAFGVSKVAENLSHAMYLFGIGSGSLFMGPLSETFGRNPTYLLFTFCYLFFVLGSALTSTFCGQLGCRYFVGVFASATLAISGASVGDQFRPVKRTFVFPVIAWANVAGTKPKMCSILEYMLTLRWSPYDGTDCGRLDRVKSSS